MKKKIENFKYLLVHSWNYSKKTYFIAFFENLFRALLPLIDVIGLGTVIQVLLENSDKNKLLRVIIYFLGFHLGVKIIEELLRYLGNCHARMITNRIQFDYSTDSITVNYHYAQNRDMLNLRSKSMSAHPAFSFVSYLGETLYYTVQIMAIIFVLSLLSPLFILLLFMTSTISINLIFKQKKHAFIFKNEKVEEDRKLDYLYQSMTGYRDAKEIRINHAEYYMKEKYHNVFKIAVLKLKKLFYKTAQIHLLSTMTTILQTIAMYFYFSYQVFSKEINIASYTILLATTTLLTTTLLGLFHNIASIDNVLKSVPFYKEYRELLTNHSDIHQSNDNLEHNLDFHNLVIQFEDVCFSYPNSKDMILEHIQLEIRQGDKIAIVGLNGSGKTTLVKLLTRLYHPTSGRITLNGVDIKTIPLKTYLSHIGVVLQDFLLFAYSVKENIIFDSMCDEERLLSVIAESGLQEKMDSLPIGVDTTIYKTLDSEGIEFSGGEGQKVALARALYKDAEILILDEPTSALDPISEYEFFSRLNRLSCNKLTIFISHRLSSTKFCDNIIVLSNGKIIEEGTHNSLIEKNGFYAELFHAQAKYYKEENTDEENFV